ncbi:stage III sporulation protein SpoIIIAB [Fictibacillus enclensis]|uniref:Stage III sporulation protein SpoAB n=1 Tax=Fictibacillus enclensis TaxID=1017270 RepID=A0A0V8JFA8_9BACL|nr:MULTISPECIES: stage III sporulation protein SpoIIIAB [Fictibacillus]KSU85716.1 stage III sporulation protein SpoAB [Fictibacillus enclensis]MDM5199665.1 stage III sporulation protein SpoIIIAB [Fictibacillus enclensis]MDM5338904.1 stage III sporulation protein SpoIIIAB [Fictibacillus enclensis]RXY98587.1 stage III sporulation protein SpoAB [Fictibacillus sp. S7]SCC01435.1 stage III sporulation protein AB [Fictibacillus enclensis]
MSWLGAVCIFISTTWIGFELAKKVRERPKQLRQLKVGLQSLEAEIMYGLIPLDEAFLHLSRQLSGPVAEFFLHAGKSLEASVSSVQEAWENGLSHLSAASSFKKEEIEILRQFGATLGRHDRENQQKQIRLALAHLERELAEANEAQLKHEKMYKSLGILLGLLIIILLV